MQICPSNKCTLYIKQQTFVAGWGMFRMYDVKMQVMEQYYFPSASLICWIFSNKPEFCCLQMEKKLIS